MPIYYKGVLQPEFPAEECPETMAAVGRLRLAGRPAPCSKGWG